MIHPDTYLKFIDDNIGYGVFASKAISKGTIVYVKDSFDIEVLPEQYLGLNEADKAILDKYSYTDENGAAILSWDHAKYVNHRCDCNTISTGYGFEIAIRDIAQDEEITDDYGLFNIDYEMEVSCACHDCRQVLRNDDIDRHYATWDRHVREALRHVTEVEQPLWRLLEHDTHHQLMSYLNGHAKYKSVMALKFTPLGKHKII